MTKRKLKAEPVAPDAAPRRGIDPAKWAAARVLWERDVTHDFKSIGTMLGCTRQRVQQKATEDSWRRTADMRHINDLAQLKADAQAAPTVTIEELAQEPGAAAPPSPPGAAPITRAEAAADERSADLRRDVLVQHRTEIKAIRARLWKAIKENDGEGVRRLKAAAETAKLLQEADRKAYAMDAPETPPAGQVASTVVIIEREVAKS